MADPVARKNITRLRVSAHRLNIESQRFNGKNQYVPAESRICSNCAEGEMEDEFHFLVKCPKYQDLRSSLYAKNLAWNLHFGSYSEKQKFLWLMSNEDLGCAKHLANFIANALAMRDA